MYDLIIIGTGPAGYSAAIYAARYKLNVLVIGKDEGGTAATAHLIENWPGIKSISGADLMNNFKEHTQGLGVEIVSEEVTHIEQGFKIKTHDKEFEGKRILLALGCIRRKLNVEGEEQYLGKGVSYCPTCDAAIFTDKTVAIIGGADSAAKAAELLVEHCPKVYMIYRKDRIRAEPMLREKVENDPKVEIITNTNVVKINGDGFVESVDLDNGQNLKVEGLFIEIGQVPSIVLAKQTGVELDEHEHIIVNEKQETSVKGVFAAGDVTTNSDKFNQIATAVGEGCVAAFNVYKSIKEDDS